MPLDTATGTLLGAIVGAATSIIANLLTSWFTLRKDRETRQDQRLAEAEKWEREQVALMLGESMKRVSLYTTIALNKSIEQLQDDPASRGANAELQQALVGLVMAYPNKSDQDYAELVKRVDQGLWKGVPSATDVWPVRQLLVKLAAGITVRSLQSEHAPENAK
jgi:hypothetical protein